MPLMTGLFVLKNYRCGFVMYNSPLAVIHEVRHQNRIDQISCRGLHFGFVVVLAVVAKGYLCIPFYFEYFFSVYIHHLLPNIGLINECGMGEAFGT